MSKVRRLNSLVPWVAAILVMFTGSLPAQEGSAIITGLVASEQGRPLGGATIFISELNAGTQANDAGRYRLVVAPARVRGQTATVTARFIGHKPQSRTITLAAGEQAVDFSLTQDVIMLQEIVTTGVTGQTERAKVPFTVSRVDSTQMPVLGMNPLSQLQGKVPGANIASVSGRPGATPSVILRGPTSINAAGRSQEPLYIVDGIVLGSSIADINPADIESVEVVKGAAASTLYGSRAASGVISITTKRAKSGSEGARFTVRSEYGMNDIERDFGIARFHPFLLDQSGTRFCVADAYGSVATCSRTMDYRVESARINNAVGDFALDPPSFPVDPGAVTTGEILRRTFLASTWPGQTFNAVEQIVDPQPVTINDVSMSGRVGATNFFSSVGYTQQPGAVMGLDGYDRINGRINVGHVFNEHWAVDVSSYISKSDQDGFNQEEGGTGFFRLTRTPAIVDITQRDSLGRLFIRTNLFGGGVQNENPLYSFENVDRTDVRYRYLANGTLKFTPLDWLDAEGSFSIDRLNHNYKQFQNRNFRTTNSNPTANNGLIFNGTDNTQSINASTQVTARRELFSGVHSRFNLRWGYEQQEFDRRQIQGQFLRVADVDDIRNATQNITPQSPQNETRQMSFAGGVFFDIFDRYTVDLLVRRDGSSRFGSEERWQTYGRGSAAWLVGRESWWPSGVLSAFTVRASLGTAGNSPPFQAQYESFILGAGGTLTAQTLGNPDLKPEVVTELELGTDIEVLGRFGLTLTYAQSDSRNQILPALNPVSSGFPRKWQNVGTLENKTWEAQATIPFIQQRDWNWTGRFTYTSNRTMIKKLNVPPFFMGTDLQATNEIIRIEEGLRYGTFYGRRFLTGCGELPSAFRSDCGGPTSAFQLNDEGYLVWVGAGNNPGMGITDNLWNAVLPGSQAPWGVPINFGMPIVFRSDCAQPPCTAQIVPLGHALPDWRMGISQNVQWKRLSVYGLVEGAFGGSAWNQGRHWSYLDFLSRDVDQAGKSLESAKPIGYYFRAPSPDGTGIGGFYDILGPNNRFVEETDYVKLRELSASYHFGPVVGNGDWTLSVIGRNLKTWTDYLGFDPEVGSAVSCAGTTNPERCTGSGLINAIDTFTFPQLRSVSVVVTTSF
jgi:TonB-linked SusC/RagA family outer membrane protein